MTLVGLSCSDEPQKMLLKEKPNQTLGYLSSAQVVVTMCSECHMFTLCKQVLITSYTPVHTQRCFGDWGCAISPVQLQELTQSFPGAVGSTHFCYRALP